MKNSITICGLINQVRVQQGLDPLTEKETDDFIEKHEKELPNGFYWITI